MDNKSPPSRRLVKDQKQKFPREGLDTPPAVEVVKTHGEKTLEKMGMGDLIGIFVIFVSGMVLSSAVAAREVIGGRGGRDVDHSREN